ncbi:30S ribosomal protein S21 [Frigoriglobus tundricola]|uniref:30S ribosomal protein S21 n=1 Tax=Frigoriglobus tundricola TaxID=2774151 RepID=UPI00148EE516|nr:30S ribosomal protein S21 [Frigoriglobus tundricola]
MREGETIRDALQRLRRQVRQQFSRSWYTSRVGYYEKPSVRKRRKQGTAAINSRSGPYLKPLKMKMGLVWIHKRKRPWP